MRLWAGWLAVAVLGGCATTAPVAPDAQGRFVSREVQVQGQVHRYQVFVPAPALAGGKPVPVILFLHGSGERGSDNQRQTEVGIGAYVRAHRDSFPAMVVFPQAPDNTEWNQNVEAVFAALDDASATYRGDPDRTYLTGLSMGGFGTWDLALRAPTRFAALVPICGGLVAPARPSMSVAAVSGESDPYAAAARVLKNVPTWSFHGAKDDVVPPEFSRKMHIALQQAGARDARHTEFPDANHNSWDPAYLHTPALWTWLFAQHRR